MTLMALRGSSIGFRLVPTCKLLPIEDFTINNRAGCQIVADFFPTALSKCPQFCIIKSYFSRSTRTDLAAGKQTNLAAAGTFVVANSCQMYSVDI
jgi:hypothetical protein